MTSHDEDADNSGGRFRRVADLDLEDGSVRSPLAGLFPEDLPVRSLEECMDALIDILPLWRFDSKNVRIALSKAKKVVKKYTWMSRDEIGAVVIYTMECTPRENSAYYVMNQALRNKDRNAVKPWRDYIWLLLHGLKQIPPCKHTSLYRGSKSKPSEMSLDDLDKGDDLTWAAFSSAATSVDVMNTFLGDKGNRTMVHLSVTPGIGREVADFSLFPDENEVLLPPNVRFEFASKYQPTPGFWMIQLSQVESLDEFLDMTVEEEKTVSGSGAKAAKTLANSNAPSSKAANTLAISNEGSSAWIPFFEKVKSRLAHFYARCIDMLEAQDIYEPADLKSLSPTVIDGLDATPGQKQFLLEALESIKSEADAERKAAEDKAKKEADAKAKQVAEEKAKRASDEQAAAEKKAAAELKAKKAADAKAAAEKKAAEEEKSRVASDTFGRLQSGMVCGGGSEVRRRFGGSDGSDYTSAMGTTKVTNGRYRWELRIDKSQGNMRIGVANPDLALEQFPKNQNFEEAWFVWTDGNASDKNSRAGGKPFKSKSWKTGDVMTVEVDLDHGTIEWMVNGVPICERQQGVKGPVSLLVCMDYEGEAVTILKGLKVATENLTKKTVSAEAPKTMSSGDAFGRLQTGMVCRGSREVHKTGGSDYTSAMGTTNVTKGKYRWELRIDKSQGNMRIGVANPDLALEQFPKKQNFEEAWFVWTDGNASDKNSRAGGKAFKSKPWKTGDIMRVDVDLDRGTIEWMVNGVPICERQQGVKGPVSLLVCMDYEGEAVTIQDSCGLV